MNSITLIDDIGNECIAKVILTYYDKHFKKSYLVYQIDKELYVSTYHYVDNKYVINNDLSEEEYDLIDKVLAEKVGDLYE